MAEEHVFQKEIETYSRELPRLLQEGHAGRHALIKGDVIVSIWDTQRDAMQAAREKFGFELAPIKLIDPRDVAWIARMTGEKKEQECPS